MLPADLNNAEYSLTISRRVTLILSGGLFSFEQGTTLYVMYMNNMSLPQH